MMIIMNLDMYGSNLKIFMETKSYYTAKNIIMYHHDSWHNRPITYPPLH